MADRAARKAKPKPVEAASLRGRVPALSPTHADALRGFFAQPRHWAAARRRRAALRCRTRRRDVRRRGQYLRARCRRHAAGAAFRRRRRIAGRRRPALERPCRALARAGVEPGARNPADAPQRCARRIAAPGCRRRASAMPATTAAIWLDFAIDDYTDDESSAPVARTRGALRVPARLAGAVGGARGSAVRGGSVARALAPVAGDGLARIRDSRAERTRLAALAPRRCRSWSAAVVGRRRCRRGPPDACGRWRRRRTAGGSKVPRSRCPRFPLPPRRTQR